MATDKFSRGDVGLPDADVTCSELSALLMSMGDVELYLEWGLSGSGDPGDIGETGSLPRRLPLTPTWTIKTARIVSISSSLVRLASDAIDELAPML